MSLEAHAVQVEQVMQLFKQIRHMQLVAAMAFFTSTAKKYIRGVKIFGCLYRDRRAT